MRSPFPDGMIGHMASKKKPARMGRPSKFTEQIGIQICELVEAGNYLETAASFCGLDRTTVRAWAREGARAKSGPKRDFSTALKRAEGRAEAIALHRIRQAGATTWQADAWFLERKWPQRWGRQPRGETDEQKAVVHVHLPDNGRMPKHSNKKQN